MTAKLLTRIIMSALLIIAVAWEAFVLVNRERGDTESEWAIGAVTTHPVFQFVAGIVAFHMLCPATRLGDFGWKFAHDYPWLLFLLGGLWGMLFWAQRVKP